MARRFEFSEESSNKFWEADCKGKTLTVRFGKIGTDGQTKDKALATPAAAAAELAKLIKEKVGKGYREVGATPAKKAPATAAAKAADRLTVEAYAAALEGYTRAALAHCQQGGKRPKKLLIEWSDGAYWCCAYNLYFADENGSYTLQSSKRDASDQLDIPGFPRKELNALRKRYPAMAEFFTDSEGGDGTNDEGSTAGGEYGAWLMGMFDEGIEEVRARLAKDRAFKGVALTIQPHDGGRVASVADHLDSMGVEEHRETLNYTIDPAFLEEFLALFTGDAARIAKWRKLVKAPGKAKAGGKSAPAGKLAKLLKQMEDPDENEAFGAASDLSALGVGIVSEVRKRFTHPQEWTRKIAFDSLAADDDYDDVPPPVASILTDSAEKAALAKDLIAGMKDKESSVRAVAAKAAGHLKDDSVLPALFSALKDKDGDVRLMAAMALGRRKDGKAFPLLQEMLRKDEEGVRNYVVRALAFYGPQAIPALLSALKDRVSYVRERAARELAKLKAVEAVPILLTWLKPNNRERDSLYPAIEGLVAAATPEAIAAVKRYAEGKEIYYEGLRKALSELGKVGSDDVVAFIAKQLAAGREEDSAIEGLGHSKNLAAVEPLFGALAKKETSVSAAEALAVLTKQKLGRDIKKWRAWWAKKRSA